MASQFWLFLILSPFSAYAGITSSCFCYSVCTKQYFFYIIFSFCKKQPMYLPYGYHYTDLMINPGWSPRGNQRWTALFHSFDVFQRWFREHDKHQRWSALFQRWSALILSDSALFRTGKFSADFLCSETLDFQRWTALIQRWFTLNQLWYLQM